ncbi:hypothetical protein L0128_11010 [candidate division KSB1 bacterium]|nr:hypothetical protein [candidate division KSB1 bacterium]
MTQPAQPWEPLPRAEVIKAVERKHPCRIPLILAKWWGEGLQAQYGARLEYFNRYPEDVGWLWLEPLDVNQMGLSWQIQTEVAHDRGGVIDDWAKLDEFIEKLPDPEQDLRFDGLRQEAARLRSENRYLMFAWWNLFFERPWKLRGMENILMDYYVAPEAVARLHAALAKLYCGFIKRAAREFQPDGFFTSDDLGHQTQAMMRPEIFDSLIKPYYAQVGQALRQQSMHWWLHSCGNNTTLLPALIETGVDVFHPVQKGTMDEVAIVREFGDHLNFLVGIDVQHTLQEKSPAGVRAEVRFLIDTFDHPEGGMCLAAGNGIVNGTPFENIDAFLDEAVVYGTKHRQQFTR